MASPRTPRCFLPRPPESLPLPADFDDFLDSFRATPNRSLSPRRRSPERHGAESRWLQAESAIEALQAEMAQCREEVAVLCECLTGNKVLSQEQFLIRLHKRRFAAACQNSPFDASVCGDDLLSTHNVVRYVCVSAGMVTMCRLRAVAGSVGAAAREVMAYMSSRPAIYVCGGHHNAEELQDVEGFSPEVGAWTPLPPMLVRRGGASAGVLAGRIYVCGGFNGSQAHNSVECFSPDLTQWQVAPNMLVARGGASAAVLANKLYVCGGRGRNREHLAQAERFDAESWEALPPMAEPRFLPAAGALGNSLYLCGGQGFETLRSAERFDPVFNIWEAVMPMLHQRAGATSAVLENRLYICGGWSGREDLSCAEFFDLSVGTWEAIPVMSHRRAAASAVASGNCVCVFGGVDGRRTLTSGEQFDPQLKTWTPLPSLSAPRESAVAVVAPWLWQVS
mmetsp:Transcript_62203/g.103360  ORF Transcript_62203/g.103360 Transcript_62203/m.103360 type:complete len:451 (-) Transcript_62203:76-1428(-)